MGKYGNYDASEDSRDDYIASALGWIANEQAEANRLKRLELQLSLLRTEIISTDENFRKFSTDIQEDKA